MSSGLIPNGKKDCRWTSHTRGRLSGTPHGLSERLAGETAVYTFGRDSSGRVVDVSLNGAALEGYQYDANGNRTRSTSGAGVVVGTYGLQDQLLSLGSAVYGYTGAGEVAFRAVGGDTTRFTYAGQGVVKSVRLPGGRMIEYLLDASGRRVGRRVDGRVVTRFLYSGALQVVAELDSAGNVATRYVYGGESNVPEYMVRGGTTYRLLQDHLGSVRAVVDAATGEIAQRLDYDSWGRVLRDSNPGFQPFGYAGGLYDPDTRLTRFGAREYDAQSGRWLSRDPIRFAGRDVNLYAYVGNDPISFSDPLGLARFCKRPLDNPVSKSLGMGNNRLLDFLNWEVSHEQLFYEDGQRHGNVGFTQDKNGKGYFFEDEPEDYDMDDCEPAHKYNDRCMRRADCEVRAAIVEHSARYGLFSYNCQEFANSLRQRYRALRRNGEC